MASLTASETGPAGRLGGTREFAPLLAVAAPVALLVVGLAAFAPALVTQDFWLALVAGREVAQHGIPTVDHLTVLASGHRWVDQQWLAQFVLYEVARMGGAGAAAAVCLLAIAVTLFFTGLTAHARGASPVSILAFLIAGVAAAPWGVQLRAQALALPLFSLTLWLLARDPDARRRSTLWVLPILCLWANLHGSAVLGAMLVAGWGVQALVRGAAGSARIRALTSVFLVTPALLASPYALSLPGYYRLMLLDPPFGRAIREWQRTTPSALTAVFFALAAAAIVLVVSRRKRLRLFDAIALLITLAVALDAIRGIVWFALAAAALVPALATPRPGTARFEGRGAGVLASAALLIAVGTLAWTGTRPAASYASRFPPALLDVVRAGTAHSNDRVLGDDEISDWLLWELPSLRGRVAYDVRFELLTRRQIAQLVAWSRLAAGWQRTTAGYSLVVANPVHVTDLVATGRWRRIFSSPGVAAAVRTGTSTRGQGKPDVPTG